MTDVMQIALAFLIGLASSTAFILTLFIGFCTLVGFAKLKRTLGRASVVKNLDEAVSHEAAVYLAPTAPRGPVDQLRPAEPKRSLSRKSS